MNNYYLVGKNIDYSLSPLIHNFLFDYYGMDARYEILNVNSIDEITKLKYAGLNITIPYKREVYKLINDSSFVSDEVKSEKSVNTIYNNHFHSTDHFGVKKTLEKIKIAGDRKIYILGSGATNKVIKSVLIDLGYLKHNIITVSRSEEKGDVTYSELSTIEEQEYSIINCSPMGNTCPLLITDNFIANADVLFDLGYSLNNELKKKSIMYGTKYVSGLYMLLMQAYKSFELWTGVYPESEVRKKCLYNVLRNSSKKIIITGMPFSGKTTMFNEVFERYHSIDIDIEIERKTGMLNNTLINTYGIDEFRKVENQVFAETLEKDNVHIIFTGGKTLLTCENYMLLDEHVVLNITPSLEVLKSRFNTTRANIKNIKSLETIYYNRIDMYNNVAHLNCTYDEAVRMIDENFNN